LGRWTSADPAGMVDGAGLYTYAMNNPAGLRDPSGRESETDKRIAQMTDVQLHRHLKGLSPEARATFTASATGKFRERASATLELGKLESIRIGVTTVEHVRPPKTAIQSAGTDDEHTDTREGHYSQSEYRGMVLAGEAVTGGTTGILNFLYAEANSRPDAGVEPTELPPGGDTWEAGGEGGLLADPAMRMLTGVATDTMIAGAITSKKAPTTIGTANEAAPKRSLINPTCAKDNCTACVTAAIKNRVARKHEWTADDIERAYGSTRSARQFSEGDTLEYIGNATGLTASARPVPFMAKNAPVGHYAIIVRGKEGGHVFYGRVLPNGNRYIYDPQIAKELTWSDLQARYGGARPFLLQ
ncbi:MAG: hypothetical protein IT372_42775, partial [Polyangiaceae bacterium]|nr:hypothetical protein [Polyangiaceae bacterium]